MKVRTVFLDVVLNAAEDMKNEFILSKQWCLTGFSCSLREEQDFQNLRQTCSGQRNAKMNVTLS